MSATVGVVVLAGGPGSRLPAAAGKHLEPVPGAEPPVPLLDHVLSRLTAADEIIVATGVRPERIERHVAARWPAARCVRVPDVSDLPGSVRTALEHLRADVCVVVEGDVIVPQRDLTRYLSLLRRRPCGEPLQVLAGPKQVVPHRCTFDLDPRGLVRAVRPATEADSWRLSVLAAAPGRDLVADLAVLAQPGPGLAGLSASIWHYVAAALLRTGGRTRVQLAADGGVNVNTRAELEAAGRYLRRDNGPDAGAPAGRSGTEG